MLSIYIHGLSGVESDAKLTKKKKQTNRGNLLCHILAGVVIKSTKTPFFEKHIDQ